MRRRTWPIAMPLIADQFYDTFDCSYMTKGPVYNMLRTGGWAP